jgi:hypothetical protein
MNEPPSGPTPLRSVRISDAIWSAAQARARTEGKTVSQVIVEALERYGESIDVERVSKREAMRVLIRAGFNESAVREVVGLPPKEA